MDSEQVTDYALRLCQLLNHADLLGHVRTTEQETTMVARGEETIEAFTDLGLVIDLLGILADIHDDKYSAEAPPAAQALHDASTRLRSVLSSNTPA